MLIRILRPSDKLAHFLTSQTLNSVNLSAATS